MIENYMNPVSNSWIPSRTVQVHRDGIVEQGDRRLNHSDTRPGAVKTIFGKSILLALLLVIGGSCSLRATPLTWILVNVTFHPGLPAVGPGGPIRASGTFTYDADTQKMLSWDITVSGAEDPVIDFRYTPDSSFVPSLFTGPISTRFVVTLPGNPPENPFGTDPFGDQSALLDLNFFASQGNRGLTNAGGIIPIVTGGTQTINISTNTHYGVETGFVTTIPEPTSLLLAGVGLSAIITLARIIHPQKSDTGLSLTP